MPERDGERDHLRPAPLGNAIEIANQFGEKIVRVEFVKCLDQRDAGADGFERCSVERVNLNSVATASGVLLKCRQEAVRAETDAGQVESVEIFGHPI